MSTRTLVVASSVLTTAALSLPGTVGDTLTPSPEPAAAVAVNDALATALREHPGHAVSVELDGESDADYLVWEIDVVSKGRLVEVEIRADNGEVLESEVEDEPEELAYYRRLLPHCEKSLAELIAAAQAVVNGKVVAAEMAIEDGQPACEVLIAHGRYRIEVEVEARAGHLLELELENPLRGEWDDEDGDDEDHDGDHDEHGHGHGNHPEADDGHHDGHR